MKILALTAFFALGISLPDCPDSPNCVSSQATDPDHHVAPLSFEGHGREEAWAALEKALAQLPRLKIVERDAGGIHVLTKSRIFGFIDDLHLVFDSELPRIHVRSASRVGYWDLGANARRVSRLREAFRAALETQ